MVSSLDESCRSHGVSSGAGIVETLMRVVGESTQNLPSAHVAYKALRLLLAASSYLCSIFRAHSDLAATIAKIAAAKFQSEAVKLHECLVLDGRV